jgi:large subunit ribosomal protein L24
VTEGEGLVKGTSQKRRKKRLAYHNAPLHKRRRNLSAHLSPKYLESDKVDYPRSAVVRKGDMVKVMRGPDKGKEGKITDMDSKTGRVAIEGFTIAKADGTQVSKNIHASNLMITKLSFEDPWRKKKLERRGSE